jgi:flagellar basal-body rod protein FlgB
MLANQPPWTGGVDRTRNDPEVSANDASTGVSDPTIAALQSALSGLSARQRAISDNVANVETPGFLAKQVDFEGSLAQAIAGGDPTQMRIGESTSTAATNLQGNNVSLDNENVSLIDTELRFQLLVNGLNSKFNILRSSMNKGS